MPHSPFDKHVLLIGASRGLGYALAQEYLDRGWHVVATVRGVNNTKLHALMDISDGRLEIETVDITVPEQITGLYERLASRRFDLLFVNAGVTNQPEGAIAFDRGNALFPLRLISGLSGYLHE